MGRKNIHKFSWTYQGLLTLGWIYHRIYYRRFTLAGKENIPRHAPVIFALNHQNALMDPLAIIFAQVRQVVFFARADIFRKKFIARILYFLKILPVYRPRDGFRSVEKNQGMFQEAIKVLKKNRTVGILPEANHVGKKRLRHLHKGAARLALQAEEQSGFQLGLRIIPVGIDYSHYFTPGADLLVVIGKPIIIKDYQEKYLENTPQAINQLTKDLAGALKKVILHIEPLEDYTALHQAIEFSTPPFIRRNNISHGIYRSFQTKQLMAERFNTLCEKGDNRIQQLISDSREYTGQLRQLKLKDDGLRKKRYTFKWIIPAILLMVALLPVYFYGMFINYLPYRLASYIARNIKDPHLKISVRFGGIFVLGILWYICLFILVLFIPAAVYVKAIFLVSLPLTAVFSLYYTRYLLKLKMNWKCMMFRIKNRQVFDNLAGRREKIISGALELMNIKI